MFWAYDPGDEFETLRSAASRLLEAGFTAASHLMRVYVLIGYPKDTFALAEQRLRQMQAHRLHSARHAVAAGDAVANEACARGELETLAAAVGAARDHPRTRSGPVWTDA